VIFKILALGVSLAATAFSVNALRFERKYFKLSNWDWIRFLIPIVLACLGLSMSCLSFTAQITHASL
jgi:hypothetical protein